MVDVCIVPAILLLKVSEVIREALLAQVLAVACSTGRVHILSSSSGSLLHTWDAQAGIRAAPAVDPWIGSMWIGTHAGHVHLMSPIGEQAEHPGAL